MSGRNLGLTLLQPKSMTKSRYSVWTEKWQDKVKQWREVLKWIENK